MSHHMVFLKFGSVVTQNQNYQNIRSQKDLVNLELQRFNLSPN